MGRLYKCHSAQTAVPPDTRVYLHVGHIFLYSDVTQCSTNMIFLKMSIENLRYRSCGFISLCSLHVALFVPYH